MIMKVVVAAQSHYETVENFSVKIMKVMVASKSCREVIASIRFLFLVKTYFAQPRSLNFFFPASHLVLGEDRQMMFVYLLRRQRSETTRFSWCFFFFLSTDASKTQISNTFVVLVLEHEYLKVELNSSGARSQYRQCMQPSSSQMFSTCFVLKHR